MHMNEELRAYIETLPFVDTHSHVVGFNAGPPLDDKAGMSLPQVLMRDYLMYMAGACGDYPAKVDGSAWTVEDAEEHFMAILPLIDEYRALSTYAALREGIREMHPFAEDDITPENWRAINDSIVKAYRTHGERAWHREAARRAGIVKQTHIADLAYVTEQWDALPADERQRQADLLMPSLILDSFLFTGFVYNKDTRARNKEIVGMQPTTHAEHLEFCAKAMDLFIAKGGTSVKLLAAYARPLYFEEVPDTVGVARYAQGAETLTGEPLRQLQDNLCWHLLEMAADRGLPLIIHTGYSFPTQYGDTEQMYNLFKSPRLRGMKIDLSHSGWPKFGEALILARTYRNAYFNMCWTPLMSPELGRHILSTAIDMTPRNKILVGTDCGTTESMLGTARMIRRQLTQVLTGKVEDGQFTLNIAKELARAILTSNPCEFYGIPTPVNISASMELK